MTNSSITITAQRATTPVVSSHRPGAFAHGVSAYASDRRFRIFVAVIAVIAFVLRFAWTARGDGLHGIGGYDDGVYYASAASMVAGRLPYRDFLLLQPPLLQLVLVPFAAAARLVGDSDAFVAARIVFMAIGALNTALIALVLRRFGAGAVVTGAVFYALFAPAVHGERTALLEPLGTLGLLIAIILFSAASPKRPRLWALFAGVALAAAVGAKLWYVLPAVLVLVTFWRRILFGAIGALLGGLAIFLPFFVAAPGNMWRQLVLDQLGRPADTHATIPARLRTILAAPDLTLSGRIPSLSTSNVALVLAVVCLALAVVTLTVRGGRLFAVMFITDLVLLLEAPSYFTHYASLTAPPLALVVGVGIAGIGRLFRDRAVRSALYSGVVVAIAFGTAMFLGTTSYGLPRDARAPVAGLITAAAPVKGCITSDDPTILALMNRITPDLERGCELWPDTTGYTYDHDYLAINGRPATRANNPAWQRDILRYLTTGDATLIVRHETGLSTRSKAVIAGGGALYKHGWFVLHAISPAARHEASR
jgi:alpha-1,2-mannosyltransferase